MRRRVARIRAGSLEGGFSYVGVLVAVLLLAVCAIPASNAIRAAIASPQVSSRAARSLLCLKSRIELVAAEPYQNLLNAAAGTATPAAAYSLPADADCGARNVYISPYNPDALPTYPAADTGLLQLVVALTDTDPGAPSWSLTTVVAR